MTAHQKRFLAKIERGETVSARGDWMTLLALGWANEFGEAGIASNCLWPQTYIATAAVTELVEPVRPVICGWLKT